MCHPFTVLGGGTRTALSSDSQCTSCWAVPHTVTNEARSHSPVPQGPRILPAGKASWENLASQTSHHPDSKEPLNAERGPFSSLPSPGLEPSSGHFLWVCTNVLIGSKPFFTWSWISTWCFNVKTRALTVRR